MSRLSTSRLVVVVLCLSAPLFADDGDLDPTFWSDGKLTVSATADLAFGGLATDAGGQLAVAYSYVAAGVPMRVSVWRSVSDSTLGTTCPVVPHFGRDTWVVDLAFDASGRLLALARDYYAPDTEDWYVLAYRFPDCELDTTFGGDGVVTFGSLTPGLSAYWRLRPLADGTILVTGYNGVYGTYGCRVQVISFNPNGGAGNVLCAPPSLFAGEIFGVDATWAPNGHVVATGNGWGTGYDFLAVDFAPDGSVAGVITVPFDLGGGNEDQAAAIVTTADGRSVVVGWAAGGGAPEWSAAIALFHWNAAGVLELDPSFSGDGKLSFTFGGRPWNQLVDVTAQGDGKILVAGLVRWLMDDRGMAVARLHLDGSFDSEFGPSGSGQGIVDFDEASPYDDLAYRVSLQNGRVVLGGTVDIANDVQSVGVARLLNSYLFADGFEVPQAPGWLWVD